MTDKKKLSPEETLKIATGVRVAIEELKLEIAELRSVVDDFRQRTSNVKVKEKNPSYRV